MVKNNLVVKTWNFGIYFFQNFAFFFLQISTFFIKISTSFLKFRILRLFSWNLTFLKITIFFFARHFNFFFSNSLFFFKSVFFKCNFFFFKLRSLLELWMHDSGKRVIKPFYFHNSFLFTHYIILEYVLKRAEYQNAHSSREPAINVNASGWMFWKRACHKKSKFWGRRRFGNF